MINPFKNSSLLQIFTSVGIWLNLSLNVIQFNRPRTVQLSDSNLKLIRA